jgi:putative ABC transport system substrate-binding protein
MVIDIGRRAFTVGLGAAAAWPLAAHAQPPTKPVIGVLGANSPNQTTEAFVPGLRESGYVEGQNVRIEYRWAKGEYEQLPRLAAELAALHVHVLVALGTVAAKAASVANGSIPIIFSMASDPVAEGFVESLNRPGRNITGAISISGALAPKRVGLMHELLRNDVAIAILINPENPLGESERMDSEAACRVFGQRLEVLTAKNEVEIARAFAALGPLHVGALVIASDNFYFGQMQRMATLAVQYSVPTVGPIRAFATEGGLMSYGARIADTVRQAGIYVGRILKGENPADLPVVQPTKFEFVLNLKTAKTLGIDVPPGLLAIADEVIE